MSVTSLHALLPEVDDAHRAVPWGLAPSSRRRCFAAGQPGVADGLMLVDSERGEEEKRKGGASSPQDIPTAADACLHCRT